MPVIVYNEYGEPELEATPIENNEAFLNMIKSVNMVWYSTPVCYACQYNLYDNVPNWWEKTSCPRCHHSFVE